MIEAKQKMFAKERNKDVRKASFEDLPDEIILKILSYVDLKDLFQCRAVNKRMKAITYDKSLWKTVHLTGEIPIELLEKILKRGCHYLSLYQCKVIGRNICFKKNFQLKYFSIHNDSGTHSWETLNTAHKIIASCHNIEKLSVKPFKYPSVIKWIVQSKKTLRVLNISGCYITMEYTQQLFSHCQELVELNINCHNGVPLGPNSVDFLCDNLTTKITKLDVTKQRNFGDVQLKKLLTRCKRLTDFAFGFTSVTDEAVDEIISNLSHTLLRIDPSHDISFGRLLDFETMPKLKMIRLGWLNVSDRKKKIVKKIMTKLTDCNKEIEIALPYPLDIGQQECNPTGFWEIKGEPEDFRVVGGTEAGFRSTKISHIKFQRLNRSLFHH